MMRADDAGAKRGRTRQRTEVGVTRALDRGLVLMEVLADARTAGLSELARATEMSPSTAFRLLETLRARGFVAHDAATGVFTIGMKAFAVGAAAVQVSRLDQVATNVMRRLSEETGETTSLAMRDGANVIYVEQIEAVTALRMSARLGTRLPLHATAAGKILLAWSWEGAIDEVLGLGPYPAVTPQTIVTRQRLMEVLAEVRMQGWALDDEECEAGLRCIAAPVRDRRGDVIAAISVSAAAGRIPDARIATRAEQVGVAGADISARLGWQGAFVRAAATDESIFMD
jgi:IclR family transcriptional regulator, acetate operon repressor